MMAASAVVAKVAPEPVQKAVVKKIPQSFETEENEAQEDLTEVPSTQVAAVVTPTTAPWHWWLAVGLLAVASASAIVFARRYAKEEWDIIEE
jgi:hypothetical protein